MKVLFIGGTGLISTASTRLAAERGIELTLLKRGQRTPDLPENVGTITADRVNIADMSLSRLKAGGTAYMVVRVDSEPSAAARQEIKHHAAIKLAKFVQL